MRKIYKIVRLIRSLMKENKALKAECNKYKRELQEIKNKTIAGFIKNHETFIPIDSPILKQYIDEAKEEIKNLKKEIEKKDIQLAWYAGIYGLSNDDFESYDEEDWI